MKSLLPPSMWLSAVLLSSCGAPSLFEAFGPASPALDPQASVQVAPGVGDVPQPAVVLGVMRLPPGQPGDVSELQAKERLKVEARLHGCDAIAGLAEVRVPGQASLKQWTADCVRSARAPKPVEPVVAKPAPEPAKPEPTATPVVAKPKSESAKLEPSRQVAGPSAAETADALCRQALKCGKKCDCSVQALLDASTGKGDGADAHAVWQALQAAVAMSPTKSWVTTEEPKIATEEEERGPDISAEDLAAELKRQGATAWKPMTPKDYTYKATLHNPTRSQVVVDVQLADGRVSKFLGPGQNASVTHTARCEPTGSVGMSRIGNVLETHFECRADPVAKVLAVRAVRRELQVDKHAADAQPTLEVVSHVWQAVPATRLTDVYLRAIDTEMGKRQRDVSSIRGRLQVFARAGSGNVPATVEFKNTLNRATTVVFDVGPLRDRTAVVPANGEVETKLELPPNAAAPALAIKGLLPPTGEDDWLVGRWTFRDVQLAVLPTGGGFVAFLPLMPPDMPPRVLSSLVEVSGNVAQFSFDCTPDVSRTLLGLAKGAKIQFTVKLDKQNQFVWGGGRALPLEVESGGTRQELTFSAEQ